MQRALRNISHIRYTTLMSVTPLDTHILNQSADTVAYGLLGVYLYRQTAEGVVGGIICETEAYVPNNDPANHASRGKTKRNASMFLPGGHWYVYLVYGIHYCLNIVTGPEESGEAVLIRGICPTDGLEIMHRNRNTSSTKHLTNGPAKLTQALGVTTDWDGRFQEPSDLFLTQSEYVPQSKDINITPRIGISQVRNRLLRYVWSSTS